MSFQSISSLQNPRIKNLVRLREANHRRRQQRFLIEGIRELQRALIKDWPIESIFFCPEFFADEAKSYSLLDSVEDKSIECVQLSHEVFRKAAYRENPDGILAVGEIKLTSLEELPCPPNPLWLILEGLEKPGNLGAILRSANAGGIDAVVLTNPVADIFNPNAIRASQGAFFDIPFAVTDNETIQDFLETRKFEVYVTTPSSNEFIWDCNLSGSTAIALGTEDKGLSDDWLNNNFTPAKLPMRGVTDSLNVSATAAVCIFEAVRQRSSTET